MKLIFQKKYPSLIETRYFQLINRSTS